MKRCQTVFRYRLWCCGFPFLCAQYLNQEKFPQLHLAVKGGAHRQAVLSIESYIVPASVDIGVCFPSSFQSASRLKKALHTLEKNKIEYRVIPETYLTTEWHGLDYLIVDPDLLSSQGFRKLQGFCGAGRTIVSLGKIMGLPYETFW